MREFKLILVGLFLAVSLQSQSVFKAVLTGEQEVPAVQSNAFGHIDAVLDGNELVVTGSFENLSSALASHIAGGIHIHTGIAGSNGPVALVLDAQVDSEMKSGEFLASENTFSLDANQIAQLQNRMMYVNIHSENFESGELRGQLLPSSDLYFQSSLSGNQEVPAVISRGSGVVLLELNGNQLTLSGSFWDLESPIDPSVAMGAHIHSGMAGENGGVDIILNVDVNAGGKSGIIHPGSNTFTVDQEMIDKINARGTYVNLHTEAFQSGELRGQKIGRAHV